MIKIITIHSISCVIEKESQHIITLKPFCEFERVLKDTIKVMKTFTKQDL